MAKILLGCPLREVMLNKLPYIKLLKNNINIKSIKKQKLSIMKKIYFIALMSAFALAAFSCNKEATEIVDKTEYDVILLVQVYTSSSSSSSYKAAKNVALTLVDHGKTCTTDSEGKATLKLQQGEYRLSVEKGYEFSSGYGYVEEFDSEEYYVFSVYGNALEIITLRED